MTLYNYSIFRSITHYNEARRDFSGESFNDGCIFDGYEERDSEEEIIMIATVEFSLEDILTRSDEKNYIRLYGMRIEGEYGNPDEEGKILADYEIIIKSYEEYTEFELLQQKIVTLEKKLEQKISIPSNLILYCVQCASEKWEKFGWIQAEDEENAIRIICQLFNLSFSICHKIDEKWYECTKKHIEYYISVDIGATSLTELIEKFQLKEHISFHSDGNIGKGKENE
jgi:hypothetical protein